VATAVGSLEYVYDVFDRYPAPERPWICTQCAPDLTAADLARTPLREMSFAHLDAVHVMSLDDDALRHYLPRLAELLLRTPAPVFDFRPAELKQRIGGWPEPERAAVRQLAEAVWAELPDAHPAALGYFADCPSALDFLDWCRLPLVSHLDALHDAPGTAAALHLGDLVDAVYTRRDPFESASATTVLEWIGRPAVGERLEAACLAETGEPAARLSEAHALWAACAGRA
jgi:hypothetical protein